MWKEAQHLFNIPAPRRRSLKWIGSLWRRQQALNLPHSIHEWTHQVLLNKQVNYGRDNWYWTRLTGLNTEGEDWIAQPWNSIEYLSAALHTEQNAAPVTRTRYAYPLIDAVQDFTFQAHISSNILCAQIQDWDFHWLFLRQSTACCEIILKHLQKWIYKNGNITL